MTVAVAQPAGAPFDSAEAVERVAALTRDAAGRGAELVVFPEAFVGGYPWGLRFGSVVGARSEAGRRMFGRYWASAVDIPGPEIERLGEIAREAGVYLCVGVIERDSAHSGGTLYCTLVYIGPDGSLLGIHRKLKPTGAERLIWGEGDGSTLTTVETPFGTVGGLICWENYMPLARMAMYGKGVEIYVAPTADARDRWISTLRHIAVEGRCFVLGCNQYGTRDMFPADLADVEDELGDRADPLSRGGSVIYDPQGELVAGPLWDRDGLLVAELELDAIARGKFDFDVTGHYARPDVFTLEVDERRKDPVAGTGGS
ncbi:MAG: carbon-nitrogen hydrolase family protein [Gemmatimonadota bacterium]|nr:carbon-nitrogen hydrolase family protein [Gemmatimonadota bacterium]